jgi:hypothetical protein
MHGGRRRKARREERGRGVSEQEVGKGGMGAGEQEDVIERSL